MHVTTYFDGASERADREREAVTAKRRAIDQFAERVDAIPAEGAAAAATASTTSTAVHETHATEDRCLAVRRAFAETVRPHSVSDEAAEPLDATVRAELPDSVAAALTPSSSSSFSPRLKQAVLSAADARRAELAATRRALDREAGRLDDAAGVAVAVDDWLVANDDRPLSALDFGTLRQRHEALSDHRDRCAALARDRQQFLRDATRENPAVAVHHDDLVDYLYRDLPVDFPVLATVAALDRTCERAQRAVREHLARRP